MLKNLNQYFSDFVIDRTIEISTSLMACSEQYKQLDDKACKIREQIDTGIPEQCKILINCLENAISDKAVFTSEFMYRQGFIDGLSLVYIHNQRNQK